MTFRNHEQWKHKQQNRKRRTFTKAMSLRHAHGSGIVRRSKSMKYHQLPIPPSHKTVNALWGIPVHNDYHHCGFWDGQIYAALLMHAERLFPSSNLWHPVTIKQPYHCTKTCLLWKYVVHLTKYPISYE